MTDTGRLWVEAMRGGDYHRAWALSDAALAARDPASRDDPALPYHRRWVWDGRALAGADVLVRCYQGLGDTLQFARYLPPLAARAGSVTVEAPARLAPLLAAICPAARLHPFDPARPLPPAEVDVEVTELAHALRLPPEATPASYLEVAPAPLPPGTLGLCHASGDWDPARSLPPALLAPLTHRPAVTLVSEPSPLPVLNPAGCPFDMAETAALVAGCALVVTVDTMIAHLAGALGRPTWLMLRAAPDWRWVPGAATTPWYPATRLFHQPRESDWESVVAEVAFALETA